MLGLQACLSLDMIKLVMSADTTDPIMSEYIDVFTGIGSFSGEHIIEVDRTVKPVVHVPRRVAFALKSRKSLTKWYSKTLSDQLRSYRLGQLSGCCIEKPKTSAPYASA